MTAVVEVGPATVRGPATAPPEWISLAIDTVDDPLALLADRPVAVSDLWRDLLAAAAGEHAEALALVVPTWWPASRLEVLVDAARQVSTEVTVLRRSAVLGSATDATVVEFSADFITVAAPGADAVVLVRDDEGIAGHIGAATAVLLDVPAAVAAPVPAVTAQIRASAAPVSVSDRRSLLKAVEQSESQGHHAVRTTRRTRLPPAVLAGATLAAAVATGAWLVQPPPGRIADPAVLVEGRAAMRVPADWVVERITAGPGSARVRIGAPGGSMALHLTQSESPVATTIDEVGASLRRALAAEPDGVFTDFDPAGRFGGRPAVTYREHRPGSETRWAVVVDGTLRIAIGCQSAPRHRDDLTAVCAEAVRSAHAVR